MTLKQQVVSLELAKKLKELGVKQESLFDWVMVGKWWRCQMSRRDSSVAFFGGEPEVISAFTVAELGEMLPKFFHVSWQKTNDDGSGMIEILDIATGKKYHSLDEPSEANARAKMLIHLIENGLKV